VGQTSFSNAVIPVDGGDQALRDSVRGKVRVRYPGGSPAKPAVVFAPKTTVTKKTLKAAEEARNQDTVLGSRAKAKVFSTGATRASR
jgi:hypothetical protein